ncbi:MAG: ATP-binding cassette domain-containing protein, partial [Gammaproteobacteria bacterium]
MTGLAKCYATTPVFEDVQIDLPRGRTLAVLGASGCGKTTLLRVIAGLEAADAGRVRLGGRDIGQLSPQQRQALYLYQEPLLFPHLDVLENVAFGLRLRRCPERELGAI